MIAVYFLDEGHEVALMLAEKQHVEFGQQLNDA